MNRSYLPPAVDVTALSFTLGRIRAAVTARACGYFWLPCPLCGIDFGGHEWVQRDGVISHIPDENYPAPGSLGPWRYIGICPFCTAAGRGWDWPRSGEESGS